MRPVKLTQGAAGSTLWLPIDKQQVPFGIGLGASITSGAVLTYSVQHTFDDPGATPRKVSISRVTTVATVVDTDHRLSVGDNIVVSGTGSPGVLDGSFAVATVVDANTYTYTVANSGPTTDVNASGVVSFRVYNHSTIVGATARVDGNYSFPVMAIRLTVTAYTSGKVDLTVLQGLGS